MPNNEVKINNTKKIVEDLIFLLKTILPSHKIYREKHVYLLLEIFVDIQKYENETNNTPFDIMSVLNMNYHFTDILRLKDNKNYPQYILNKLNYYLTTVPAYDPEDPQLSLISVEQHSYTVMQLAELFNIKSDHEYL